MVRLRAYCEVSNEYLIRIWRSKFNTTELEGICHVQKMEPNWNTGDVTFILIAFRHKNVNK